jgi:clan AA aspartic protease
MGRVATKLNLINLVDLQKAREGSLAPSAVRAREVEALVDTGATMLAIPADAAEALGLPLERLENVRLADGTIRQVPLVTCLRIEILGRSMACDALVLPVGSTPLIGQIPLEALDLIVDPKSREARVNPASPDAPTLDLLRAS